MGRKPPLVGTSLFGPFLTSTEVNSSQPATAIIPKVIAGHNRAYYEHITGNQYSTAAPQYQAAVAPLNAYGQLGENHTGAGFGKALKHTVFHIGFADGRRNGTDPPTQGTIQAPPNIKINNPGDFDPISMEFTWSPMNIPRCHRNGDYVDAQVDFGYYCIDLGSGDLPVLGVDLYTDYNSEPIFSDTDTIDTQLIYYEFTGTIRIWRASTMRLVTTLTPNHVADVCDISLSYLSISQVS